MPLSKPWWSSSIQTLSKMGCVAERQIWQALLCWSICTFQLCLKGGTSPVTFCSPPKYRPFIFFVCVRAWFWKWLWKKKKRIWFTENYITCTQPLMIPLCEYSSSVNKVEVLLYRGCFVFTTCRLQCASFLILHNFFLIHGMALLMDLKVTLNLKYNLMSITSMFCTNKDFAKPFLLWWISFLRVCSRSCIDCIYMLARMSGSGLADW